MRYTKFLLLSLIVAASSSMVGFAQSVKVVSAVKASKDDTEMILSLLKVHLEAETSGREVKPYESIDVTIIGFGDGFRISASKKRGGKTAFSSNVVATSNTETDRVLKRLARELANEKTTADVDNVTNSESTVSNVKKSNYSRWSFEFGPHAAFGMGEVGTLFHWNLGYHLEQPQYRIGLFYDRASPIQGNNSNSDVSLSHLGLSGDWMFGLSDNAPYIGTELSYGSTQVSDVNLYGFSTSVRLGYLWFRTTKAQLNTSVLIRPVFQKINRKFAGSGGLSVGLEF